MNKVILMSIQPKWLVKILNGDKTIEIRKTIPKCELPIDVYLYCTKGKPMARYEAVVQLNGVSIGSDYIYETTTENDKSAKHFVNGKVVAKFTLNRAEEITPIIELWKEDTLVYDYKTSTLNADQLIKKAYMYWDELNDYLKCKKGYAWHIDNLVVFDKPKELSEFETNNIPDNAVFESRDGERYFYLPKRPSWHFYSAPLTKAPQSWQYAYVEEKFD